MSKISAEVFADHQHGPGVTVCVDGVRVSVYMFGETGIVTRDDGQHGVEVTGPWADFREQARQLLTGSTGEDDLIGRITFRIAKLDAPGWLMPQTVELLRDCKSEIEQLQCKLRSVEEELVAANQRCHDLIRGGEKILTERDSYALRLSSCQDELGSLRCALDAGTRLLQSYLEKSQPMFDGEIEETLAALSVRAVDQQERNPYRDAPLSGPGSRLHDQLKEIKRGDG